MFSSWQSHFLTSAHMVHTLLFIFKPTRNSKNFENLIRGHLMTFTVPRLQIVATHHGRCWTAVVHQYRYQSVFDPLILPGLGTV